MRKPLIAGNWKMNTTITEAVQLTTRLRSLIDGVIGIEKVVCPPFVSISSVKEVLKNSSISIGAQNMYFQEKGAFTGEVSPLMLKELCDYVILGHSERRQLFGETSEIVNRKLQTALKFGLKPIVCIGENLAEYEAGQSKEVVRKQILASLAGTSNSAELVIAYEPIWAIGTGKAATGLQANQIIKLIRDTIAAMQNPQLAAKLRILYGGSVTPENIVEFLKQPEIDGALVGGASLKAEQFASIVKQTAEIKI
ncbi:MAG TPA: triose-phosphate isomerase [Dehalococcoidales bacterium]|nr:triose-phosphate isomerase [Dehalococcoidales bacterium]